MMLDVTVPTVPGFKDSAFIDMAQVLFNLGKCLDCPGASPWYFLYLLRKYPSFKASRLASTAMTSPSRREDMPFLVNKPDRKAVRLWVDLICDMGPATIWRNSKPLVWYLLG
jgi:hypothetical protein